MPFKSEAAQKKYRRQYYYDNLRDKRLLAKYGITREHYERLLVEQNGVCVVCRRPPKPGTFLEVEHCHESNVIRGLACPNCNKAIGLMDDDAARLRAAADHVERNARKAP